MKRRLFLATAFGGLAGCGLNNKVNEGGFHRVLEAAEPLDDVVIGTRGRAKLYTKADIDWNFRTNGFDTPSDSAYRRMVADGFRSYRLIVDGEVERRGAFTLPELRAMQPLTQITRHDCVEGWSAIGEWSGVPLGTFLRMVGPTARARYVVFHCMDRSPDGVLYYESLDLHQAAHPQTLLALDLNGKPLDPDHGAPVRLRIPTELGYKSAKWVHRIQLASSFAGIGDGKGGYWEDQGYEWYAGI
ncbi:MAG: molybdopterin-dependent oxidoreductase [Candidatus Eremiobacteraeota bacterium]|nr:molybdopterin-dependent oxidoreductase [Candidatus Eremiobacteraeota bacterium]